MNVSEAVASRTSIRAFLPTPVERAVIERVLDKARFAPSGGNLQPWHAVVVAGEPLKRLLDNVQTSSHSNPEYQNYPSPLPDPWMARRRECGFDMYAIIGIAREDKQARDAQTARNFIGLARPACFSATPRE